MIEVLTRMLNDIWKYPMMPITIFAILVAEAVALYVLLTSIALLPISLIAVFSFVAIDFFIMIHFIFKILSYPFTKSNQYLQTIQRVKKPTKWLNRFIRSCSPAMISMGDGTFLDECTSLVIWKLCIDLLVTFLLL